MSKQYQDSNQETLNTPTQSISNLFQISFYVPVKDCEAVKQAMFDAGAGIVGNYQECAWQTLVKGQFKPLPGSKPHIGEVNTLESVEEFKVEMVCADEYPKSVVQALKSSHPYEVPAFSVIKLEAF